MQSNRDQRIADSVLTQSQIVIRSDGTNAIIDNGKILTSSGIVSESWLWYACSLI